MHDKTHNEAGVRGMKRRQVAPRTVTPPRHVNARNLGLQLGHHGLVVRLHDVGDGSVAEAAHDELVRVRARQRCIGGAV